MVVVVVVVIVYYRTEDKARRVHAKCAALKEQLEQLRDENLALGAENGKASAELRASTAKVRFLEEELEWDPSAIVPAGGPTSADSHLEALNGVALARP